MGGSTNRTDYDVGVIFNAIELIIHPGYNSNTFHNDVALVRIEGTFGGYENVAPIPLRTRTIFTSSSNPVYCTVSGWGLFDAACFVFWQSDCKRTVNRSTR